MSQLAFDFSPALPAAIFARPDDPYKRDWLHRTEEADRAFPVEYLEGGVSLRAIENGVWLWGADWNNKKTHSGGGFAPFRKWGPSCAAMSREAAIDAARLYIKERMQG